MPATSRSDLIVQPFGIDVCSEVRTNDDLISKTHALFIAVRSQEIPPLAEPIYVSVKFVDCELDTAAEKD